MKLSPDVIAPSQDFLKPNTVAFIFRCIASGQLDQLPPAPIVRQDQSGNYVAIDGHNLIVVRSFLGEEIEVHIAHSADDGLDPVTKENIDRNADLLEKYESCITERDRVREQGIETFQDLITANQELFIQTELNQQSN